MAVWGRDRLAVLVALFGSAATVSCSAVTTTLGSAASGPYDGTPTVTHIAQVDESTTGVAVGPKGEVYVVQEGCVDLFTNSGHRWIPAAVFRVDGSRTLIAGGRSTCGFSGDGGPATQANLDEPLGIVADAVGNLYISDQYGERVRKISAQGVITTIAGSGPAEQPAYAGDGGPATRARMNRPCGLALDNAGNLYVTELENNVVRKITPAGIISTIAGKGQQGFTGDGGAATAAELNFPNAVAADASHIIYISDNQNYRVREVNSAGAIVTVAGNGQDPGGFDTGFADGAVATHVALDYPDALAIGKDGTVFIGTHGTLLRLSKDGTLHQVALPSDSSEGMGLASDAAGNLYVLTDSLDDRQVYKLTWQT